MDHQESRRYLLSIRSTAESIMKRMQPKGTTKVFPSTCAKITIPVLDLPFPSNLDATLKTLGLSERGHYEASRKIREWVHDLQNSHSLYFQRACHNLASLPHLQSHTRLDSAIENLRLVYQNKYVSYLPLVAEQVLSTQAKQNTICKNSKTPFNNVSASQAPYPNISLIFEFKEYTPHLEMYFETNAYPSLPDRKLLARKSTMTLRQIEVWVSPFP